MNNDPFASLDEDQAEDDDEKGLAWLPLTLGAIALTVFLAIPVLGLFYPGSSSEWEDFTQGDGVNVSLSGGNGLASQMPGGQAGEAALASQVPVPNPDEYMLADLKSVDETLSSLGGEGAATDTGGSAPGNRISFARGREVPLSAELKNGAKGAAGKAGSGARRVLPVSKAEIKELAAVSPKTYHEVTVKPGETLYGIARDHGTTPESIADMNGMRRDDPIATGRILRVPDRPASRAPRPVSQPQGPVHTRPAGNNPSTVTPLPPRPGLFPSGPGSSPTGPIVHSDSAALPREGNPLDRYQHAIAYRVQALDNLNRIAESHATTPQELIELNGRSQVRKGEMLVVPVDKCLIKNGQ